MLLVLGVHHFRVTVSLSPFSRVLLPAMCKSPARWEDKTWTGKSWLLNEWLICKHRMLNRSRRLVSQFIEQCPLPVKMSIPALLIFPISTVPTTFKKLQVSVFVMQELDVVIGWRVGVLLFLSIHRDNDKHRSAWMCTLPHTHAHAHKCTNTHTNAQTHTHTLLISCSKG